jgi:hypothetical protein
VSKTKPTDTIAEAEATLAGFQKQRTELLARQAKLANQKSEAAYSAHVGDIGSCKLLSSLKREAAEVVERLDSVSDAIAGRSAVSPWPVIASGKRLIGRSGWRPAPG